MIKYIDVPEKKITVAIIENTGMDAMRKIQKITQRTPFIVCTDKYMMPNSFRVELHCDPRDSYSIEEGHRLAKRKVLKNYYKSLDNRLRAFQNDLDSVISNSIKKIGNI